MPGVWYYRFGLLVWTQMASDNIQNWLVTRTNRGYRQRSRRHLRSAGVFNLEYPDIERLGLRTNLI